VGRGRGIQPTIKLNWWNTCLLAYCVHTIKHPKLHSGLIAWTNTVDRWQWKAIRAQWPIWGLTACSQTHGRQPKHHFASIHVFIRPVFASVLFNGIELTLQTHNSDVVRVMTFV
jgi:hypothetical protein